MTQLLNIAYTTCILYDDIVVVGKHAIRFFDNFQFLLFDFSSPALI